MLWMEARVIFERSYGGINLRVQAAHPLFDVGVDTVSEFARALLLGLIVGAVQGTAVLQFPDAQILQHAFAFLEFEPASTDVARNLQAFRQVLLVIPTVELVLVGGINVHHHHQDGIADGLCRRFLIVGWHAVPSMVE
jgi:hypothetical protein